MKKRIGITQRVEVIASYRERRDCLDQQWFVLLEHLGLTPVPVPNSLADVRGWCSAMALDGLILTGGNDLAHLPCASNTAPERDATETALLDYARAEKMPVLGVCRGMQSINHHLGGSLVPVGNHSGTRHSVEATGAAQALKVYAGQTINSFHDWSLPADGLGDGLVGEILAPEGEVEGFRHGLLPWLGIMWHPERESPFNEQDMNLLKTLFRRIR